MKEENEGGLKEEEENKFRGTRRDRERVGVGVCETTESFFVLFCAFLVFSLFFRELFPVNDVIAFFRFELSALTY